MAAGGGGDADADEAADHQREHGELLRGEDAGGAGIEADEAQQRPDELAAEDVEQQDGGDEPEGGDGDPALTPVPKLDQPPHSWRHVGAGPPRRQSLRQPWRSGAQLRFNALLSLCCAGCSICAPR